MRILMRMVEREGGGLGEIEKIAKITSMKRRQQMRRYREQNKARIQRKRKIRREKQKAGVKPRHKRVGSPAGGYQFVRRGPESPSGGGGGGMVGQSLTSYNFDPEQQPRTTEQVARLRRVT